MNTKRHENNHKTNSGKTSVTQATPTKKHKAPANQRVRIIILLIVIVAVTIIGLGFFNWLSELDTLPEKPAQPTTTTEKSASHTLLKKKHDDTESNGKQIEETPHGNPPTQANGTSNEEHAQPVDPAHFVAQDVHNALHMAEAMDAIDQINQAIVSIRISHQQLSNQQDPSSADAWLKLSIQPIKRARLIDDVENKLLGSIATLREKIDAIQKPNLQITQERLKHLQTSIQALTAPVKIDRVKQKDEPATDTTNNIASKEKTGGFWQQWQQSIAKQFDALYEWVINSIRIDTIDSAQYQTFRHTLGAQFFHNEMQLLIEQASMATTFNDQKTFDYLCAQIKAQILFHIQEPKMQTQLIEMVDEVKQQPIAIQLPDYLPLIQACQDVLHQLHPVSNMGPPKEKIESQNLDTKPSQSSAVKTDLQPQHTTVEPLSFLNVQAAKT